MLPLTVAMSLALTTVSTKADVFQVTVASDNGTGLVDNSLSWAILQANTTPGTDTIELKSDVLITGVMKRLIDSDTTLQSDATRRTIDGNNQFRPLFVKSGHVLIQNLDIENGFAKGGSSGGGGAGAGLGGGIFIYNGNVNLQHVNFTANKALGGSINLAGKYGGGGMFGSGNFYGGGGLFGDAIGNFVNGGYGGYGNYQTQQAPNFGEGGGYVSTYLQALGGFGGGGAYSYDHFGAHGGFGGGGGFAYNDYSPQFFGGNGGFGAGGGLNRYAASNDGIAGFGGSGQYAAGFGGALFIRSGQLLIGNISFNNNNATSNGSAEGFGGAMFIQHLTIQSNNNNQGMPGQTPTVFGCSVMFSNNTADTDPDTALNNDDYFNLADSMIGLSGSSISNTCLNDQEVQIMGNGIEVFNQDLDPDVDDGTNFGQVMANYHSKVSTFRINNLGSSLLVLNGAERIELSDNFSGMFSVLQFTETDYVAGNQNSEFKIAFTPTSFGASIRTATVVIRSNDSDEPVYSFSISGQGIPYSDMIFVDGFE